MHDLPKYNVHDTLLMCTCDVISYLHATYRTLECLEGHGTVDDTGTQIIRTLTYKMFIKIHVVSGVSFWV